MAFSLIQSSMQRDIVAGKNSSLRAVKTFAFIIPIAHSASAVSCQLVPD
jgi:hypothetical protein